MEFFWRILGYPALLFQVLAKIRYMAREFTFVLAPESDIEIVTLAEYPAVPLQVRCKKQFRFFRIDLAVSYLLGIHFEFDFLGSHG